MPRLKEKGVGFIDALVSGGELGAVAGTLAIMAGGEEKDLRVERILISWALLPC